MTGSPKATWRLTTTPLRGSSCRTCAATPVTMERYPAGIDKKGFWQKDVSKGFPDWLKRVDVPKKDGVVHRPFITDRRSLMWVTNQNTITQHVWPARTPDLYYPDICVFDLDPSKDDPAGVRAAAIGLRDLLEELALPSWIKTSGSKGFHLVVPLDDKMHVGQVARFAHAVGALLVSRAPDHLTQEFSRAESQRTNLCRHGQKTATAPRLRQRAPVRAKRWRACVGSVYLERGPHAATSARARSPCGTCPTVSRRSAICGVICGSAASELKRPIEMLRRLVRRSSLNVSADMAVFCQLGRPLPASPL